MTADQPPRGAGPQQGASLPGAAVHHDAGPPLRMPLRGAGEPLASLYDVALLDLDGVVYLGGYPIPGAADALAKAAASGMRLAFVTNNASRTPSAIAAQLTGLGVPAKPDEVITSAQAAARLAAWAEVMTSSGFAGTPSPVSWAAIAEGVREALLVTNASRMPDAAALASASAAPGMGAPPR